MPYRFQIYTHLCLLFTAMEAKQYQIITTNCQALLVECQALCWELKICDLGASLVVQGLRLRAPNAGAGEPLVG